MNHGGILSIVLQYKSSRKITAQTNSKILPETPFPPHNKRSQCNHRNKWQVKATIVPGIYTSWHTQPTHPCTLTQPIEAADVENFSPKTRCPCIPLSHSQRNWLSSTSMFHDSLSPLLPLTPPSHLFHPSPLPLISSTHNHSLPPLTPSSPPSHLFHPSPPNPRPCSQTPTHQRSIPMYNYCTLSLSFYCPCNQIPSAGHRMSYLQNDGV